MYIPKRQGQDVTRQAELLTQDEDFEGIEETDIAEEGMEEAPEFLKSKSNVELIDDASNSYTEKATNLVQRLITAQNPSVLDREALVFVANLQRERFFGCLSLPFSLLFFLIYAASVSLHEDITNVYFIESGMRNALGGDLEDVGDIPSMWEWIQTNTLVPTIFNQDNVYGDKEKDKRLWNRVLMYNQLTGPMVLEQVRSEKELCFDGDGIYGDMICYPKSTNSEKAMKIRPEGVNYLTANKAAIDPEKEGKGITLAMRTEKWDEAFQPTETKSVLRRLRVMRTEYMGKLPGGSLVGKPKKFIAFFYPQSNRTLIDRQAEYLKQAGWIDESTKQLRAKVSLLNAEIGRPRLTQVKVTFRFNRAGGIFSRLTIKTIFLKMHAGGASMGADFLFLVMLIVVCIFEVLAGKKAIEEKQCLKHLRKPWTILEFLIIFIGLLVLIGYIYQDYLRTTVKNDLKLVVTAAKQDVPPENASPDESGDSLSASSDNYVWFTTYFQLLQAEYHLVLMFRFFTAFSAQPRLGVVTSTLEACVVDIIHFLIVLLPTFMAYSISGVFLFGRRLQEFSTFDAAVGTCFKMAMEGEFDWGALSSEHWWTAALYTWSFMVLIVLLMVSMVLAIVMDVYTAKRKAAGQSETVGVTLYHYYQRFRNSRVWVSNKDLIEKCATMERLVHREDLLQMFPGFCDEQLSALMIAVKYHSELMSAGDMDITDSMKMTMAVKLAIDKVNDDLKALQDGAFKGIEKESEKSWLNDLAVQMAASNHWMLTTQWKLQQLQWQWAAMQGKHGTEYTYAAGPPPKDAESEKVL